MFLDLCWLSNLASLACLRRTFELRYGLSSVLYRPRHVGNAPYLAWRSQLVQQRQPGVQLHQDGRGHKLESVEGLKAKGMVNALTRIGPDLVPLMD